MNSWTRPINSLYQSRKQIRLLNSTFDAFGKGDNLRLGYAVYCAMCKQRGITPESFRVWARIDFEYDVEWEAANYEWDHAAY